MSRLLVAALLLAAGCDQVCDGPACAAMVDLCAPAPEARLGLQHRSTLVTDEDDNPEIIQFLPGEDGRAIVTYTDANRLAEVFADEDELTIGAAALVPTGNLDSDLAAVSISPDGTVAAIAVPDYSDPLCTSDDQCVDGRCVDGRCQCLPGAVPGCACGSVIFVDLRPGGRFGAVLGRIGVGWAPDSSGFSPDGRYLITADEDDRDIDPPCKPEERWGGSVSIIEFDPDPTRCQTPVIELGDLDRRACRVQQIAVDADVHDEPEEAVVSPLGTAVIAIQDSDRLGFIDLDQVPAATIEIVELGPAGSSEEQVGPDGIDISPDGRLAAVGLEDEDALLIVDVQSRAILARHPIGPDVPSSYNRDERKVLRQHEPEQVEFVESQGAWFVLLTLQESSAAIAYRVTPAGEVTFDSIQPVGFGYVDEVGGSAASIVGPEGMSALPDFRGTGRTLMITANEREGSLTLLRSYCPEPPR